MRCVCHGGAKLQSAEEEEKAARKTGNSTEISSPCEANEKEKNRREEQSCPVIVELGFGGLEWDQTRARFDRSVSLPRRLLSLSLRLLRNKKNNGRVE